jgi:carboxymethylenebutenolidase
MALEGYLAQEVALDCAEGRLTRRDALRRLVMLGLSATGATALLAACGADDTGDVVAPTPTAATTAVPATTAALPTDPAPTTTAAPPTSAFDQVEEIRFAGPRGELIGLLATPPEPKGAVLVIHENRGLTPHIRSIPPRLAVDDYTALAIDLLSEEGGTASMDDAAATAALAAAPLDRIIADLRAGLDELARRTPSAGLAAIGFCFGGGLTWQLLAAGEPRLRAAVPFYGPAPDAPDFSGSPNAAVLGIYAGNDTRVNADQDVIRAALTAAGLTFELKTYDGVDHAFFNDTGPRYAPEAAKEAYQAMLDWFAAHL